MRSLYAIRRERMAYSVHAVPLTAFSNKRKLVSCQLPMQTKLKEGENILILEIKKTNKKREDVKIAVNMCDLDGDRLSEISLEPESSYI